MATYASYNGPAGASEGQMRKNTKALAERTGAKVVFADCDGTGDKDYWASKNGRHVIYDRWGFCSADGQLDQVSFDDAVKYLTK